VKILGAVVVLVIPYLLQAVSFGLSFPVDITQTQRLSYSDFQDVSYEYQYKHLAGLGIVLDTNVAKEETFGYRVALEYTLSELKSTNRRGVDSLRKHKYNIVNTFAFGVIQEPYFKWWVGPRINIEIEHASGSDISYQNSWGWGFGAATGVNVKIAKRIALAADLAYQGKVMFGGESYQDQYSVFSGTSKGATAHLYLLFVFGETAKPIKEASVIDESL